MHIKYLEAEAISYPLVCKTHGLYSFSRSKYGRDRDQNWEEDKFLGSKRKKLHPGAKFTYAHHRKS